MIRLDVFQCLIILKWLGCWDYFMFASLLWAEEDLTSCEDQLGSNFSQNISKSRLSRQDRVQRTVYLSEIQKHPEPARAAERARGPSSRDVDAAAMNFLLFFFLVFRFQTHQHISPTQRTLFFTSRWRLTNLQTSLRTNTQKTFNDREVIQSHQLRASCLKDMLDHRKVRLWEVN